MPLKLSACVEMIFRDLPFLERLERVAEAGIPAFEFWRLADKDVEAIRRKKDELGLAVAAFIGHGGVPLVDVNRRADAVSALRQALDAAERLDCRALIITVGQALPDRSRAEQHQAIVGTLTEMARLCEGTRVTLALEPLNVLVDHKGYYLDTSAEGFEIVDEVGSPHVKLLYDIYHQQITEGNLINTITANLDKIAHLHVADVPGRHEPGTGEINYRNVFKAVESAGFQGYVGLEYRPLAEASETLQRVKALVDYTDS